jgi:hypothetical protein
MLYVETNNEVVKDAAVQLLIGDFTIKQLKNMTETKMHIKAASRKLRKRTINSKELHKFIEDHIYTAY